MFCVYSGRPYSRYIGIKSPWRQPSDYIPMITYATFVDYLVDSFSFHWILFQFFLIPPDNDYFISFYLLDIIRLKNKQVFAPIAWWERTALFVFYACTTTS